MPPGSGPGEAAPRVAPLAVGHADRVREAHQDVGGTGSPLRGGRNAT